ncbi:MAG: S8 family serine peptidase [Kofleriaceae bacterium]
MVAYLAVLVVSVTSAVAAPFRPLCADHSCKGYVAVDAEGAPLHFATPMGFTAPQLQAMYGVDPSLGDGLTIAVIDAFGYEDLESDLATYRAQFGLPPCTIASGCLTILNNAGATAPLLADSDTGWIGETALDVQMVSAICPKCKIVVVQTDGAGKGLEVGQIVARALAVDTISNSWGGGESAADLASEGDYNNPGIGTFASTGDDGFASGAQYPASSAYVVAVGGVSFDGTTTKAWGGAGSGCSTIIQMQPWAPQEASCEMRAYADIAALADPNTGVAVFNAKQGKWQIVGGTSAASPIAAAMFAAAGHADARPEFVYRHRDAFTDVTDGSNGACGPLCDAKAGWDGPTGIGVPDQAKLLAIGNVAGAGPTVTIGFPRDGANVTAKFTIQAVPDPATTAWVDVEVDGVRVTKLGADPWTTTAPGSLTNGSHVVTVTAYDLDHDSRTATATVTLGDATPPDTGICSAGGRPGGLVVIAFAGWFATRRRRRATAPAMI